jgi:hypothetical protein
MGLTVMFDGGPRAGTTDEFDDRLPATIGDGSENGVYQRTDEERDGMTVYRWQPLTDAEVEALVRGDIRANQ